MTTQLVTVRNCQGCDLHMLSKTLILPDGFETETVLITHVMRAEFRHQAKKLYRRVSAIDDGRQRKHCPVCIQNDWIDNRVLDDGNELLHLGIVVQVVLHKSTRKLLPCC